MAPTTFRRLCRARALLDRPSAETGPVRTIAQAVGLSHHHFIRRFEALFGRTPHQYRIEQQLRRAKALLAGGATVTDACMTVGFSSLGSFSASFHRRAGETPSAFGRRLQAEQAPGLQPGCLGLMAHLLASAPAISEKPAPSPPWYRPEHHEER